MMKRHYFLLIFCFPILIFGQEIPNDFYALWASKSYDELTPKLEQFIVLHPTNYKAIELLGDVYGSQLDWNSAAYYYEKLVQAKPSVADYHYKYGGVLGQKAKQSSRFDAFGLIHQVKKSFSQAATLDSKHWEVRWALVELFVQLPAFLGGSYKKALAYAEELESISKINGYFAKAYIYEHKKDIDQSNIFVKKGAELRQTISCLKHQNKQQSECKSHNNSLHYDLALACTTGRIDMRSSIFLLNKYISEFNSIDRTPLEMAHYQLARLYLKQKKEKVALHHLETSLKLNSKFELAKNEKMRILMSIAH